MPGMTAEHNALVLTNGHCLNVGDYKWEEHRFLHPGQVLVDYDLSKQRYAVTVFKNRGQAGRKYQATKIIFGTITGTDLAVIELNVTYSILKDAGYSIYSLSERMPDSGTRLDFISYFEKFDGLCTVQELSPIVVEGPFVWNDVIKMKVHRMCRVYPGVSGTPGILRGSNTIYAVGNTEFTGVGESCAIMNPCERDVKSGQLRHGVPTQTYAIPVAPLYGCYDKNSARFDFTVVSCRLGKPNAGQ